MLKTSEKNSPSEELESPLKETEDIKKKLMENLELNWCLLRSLHQGQFSTNY